MEATGQKRHSRNLTDESISLRFERDTILKWDRNRDDPRASGLTFGLEKECWVTHYLGDLSESAVPAVEIELGLDEWRSEEGSGDQGEAQFQHRR